MPIAQYLERWWKLGMSEDKKNEMEAIFKRVIQYIETCCQKNTLYRSEIFMNILSFSLQLFLSTFSRYFVSKYTL